MKRQLNKRGEIFANDMTNKDWIFQIYKHILQPNIKNKKTWMDIFQKSHTDDQQVHEKMHNITIQFSSVQSLSHVRLFVTPWTAAHQASLSFTISWSLLKLMSVESMMPSNHLVLCHPLLLLPSVFPSISLFWWVDSSKQAAKVLDFSISPCNEYSGLISFRVDWFDLLALQGTLKSLLQHHNSKASIPWCSAFFLVQLSHPYITTGKTIALTIRTCVTK